MNEINKTLYIPLYGKAQISKKGLIIKDPKAEEIWENEQFALKGNAKSKWLTYFMAMRAKVFDEWTRQQISNYPQALVLHIGCGMDSRVLRVGGNASKWYDIDFPDVILERKKYYSENDYYSMVGVDVSKTGWIRALSNSGHAIVVLEGISMYLNNENIANLFSDLQCKFERVNLLMDAYTTFGAKASKYKNPINSVGVRTVYGIDNPEAILTGRSIEFVKEHSMTPEELVDELCCFDKLIFKKIFTGTMARRVYKLYEYRAK